jgi:hypothetical protein
MIEVLIAQENYFTFKEIEMITVRRYRMNRMFMAKSISNGQTTLTGWNVWTQHMAKSKNTLTWKIQFEKFIYLF